MPRQRSYKPRIFGRTGDAAAGDVPVQDNLSDFMDIVRVGVEEGGAGGGVPTPYTDDPRGGWYGLGLPEDAPQVPTGTAGNENTYRFQPGYTEGAAASWQDLLKNPPKPDPTIPYTRQQPGLPSPLTPPEYQDPGATVRGMLKWLPLVAALGGPRAIGAIAPGAIGGVANYAQQDYANRLNAYKVASGSQNEAYDNALNQWKAGADVNIAQNRDIVAGNVNKENIWQNQLTGAKGLADNRRLEAKDIRLTAKGQLINAREILKNPQISPEVAQQAVKQINDANAKLAQYGAADLTDLDPDTIKQNNWITRAQLEANKIESLEKRSKWYTEAMKYGARMNYASWDNTTKQRIAEDARQFTLTYGLRERQEERMAKQQGFDHELKLLGINVDVMKFRTALESQFAMKKEEMKAAMKERYTEEYWNRYKQNESDLAEAWTQFDTLAKDAQATENRMAQGKNDRGYDPTRDEEKLRNTYLMMDGVTERIANIRRDNDLWYQDTKLPKPYVSNLQTPTLPSAGFTIPGIANPGFDYNNPFSFGNPTAAPNSGKPGAEPQKGPGKFGGGRREHNDSADAKDGTDGGEGGARPRPGKEPGTGRPLNPNLRSERQKGPTPEQAAALARLKAYSGQR